MLMDRFFYLSIIILLSSGCKPKEKHSFFMDNILGCWEMEGNNLTECWTKENDILFSAQVYSVSGLDTAKRENIRLYYTDEKWIYEPTVHDQNNGEPIPFACVSKTDSLMHFSNPKHETPSDIIYSFLHKDTILITLKVSGGESYRLVYSRK
jgi:hypothetical protein